MRPFLQRKRPALVPPATAKNAAIGVVQTTVAHHNSGRAKKDFPIGYILGLSGMGNPVPVMANDTAAWHRRSKLVTIIHHAIRFTTQIAKPTTAFTFVNVANLAGHTGAVYTEMLILPHISIANARMVSPAVTSKCVCVCVCARACVCYHPLPTFYSGWMLSI